MGRGAGCCNFKYTVNCTAPPCPEGTCCYLDLDETNDIKISMNINAPEYDSKLSISSSQQKYICEDKVTENCCLAKQKSFFNPESTCGEIRVCDNESSIAVPTIVSTDKAFILLKHNGTVQAWGDSRTGGAIPYGNLTNIVELYTNSVAVVAVDKDGQAFCWGDINVTNFDIPGPRIPNRPPVGNFENIKSVTGSLKAFAAIRTDGTVVAWGDPQYGGAIPDSISSFLVDIVEIASTDRYFAARNKDGRIYIWGNGEKAYDKRDTNRSGSITSLDALLILNFLGMTQNEVISNPDKAADFYHSAYDVNRDGKVSALDALLILNALAVIGATTYDSGFTDVKKIYSNKNAFAFLKNDNTVLAWGNSSKGGNTGSRHSLLTNVKEIYNTDEAFLALRTDNKAVVWGDIDTTLSPDFSHNIYSESTEILDVYPSKHAFGVSYISITSNSQITTINQYFNVFGAVVKGKENIVERNGSLETSRRFKLGLFNAGFINTSDYDLSIPYDHDNPPTDIDGKPFRAKRDFYASKYAFHYVDRVEFVSIGNYPNDTEYNSHTSRGGVFGPLVDRDRIGSYRVYPTPRLYLDSHENPFLYSRKEEKPVPPAMKGAKKYVCTLLSSHFVSAANRDSNRNFSNAARAIRGFNDAPDPGYIVSFGNANYGGAASFIPYATFSDVVGWSAGSIFGYRELNPYRNSDNTIFELDNFVGLFSNDYAVCAIRFPTRYNIMSNRIETANPLVRENIDNNKLVNDANYGHDSEFYQFVTWGHADLGGDSSSVDFSDVFANKENLKFTYEGCNPKYCDQDI